MRFWKVQRVAVIKLTVNNRYGNGTGSFEVKIGADTTKFTNVVITRLKYKLLCPRGTQTCTLAVANIKVNGNGKVILDTHPESDQHQN